MTGASKGVTSTVIAMVLTMSTIPNTSIADSEKYQEADFAESVQLSTSEILETFSDTLDIGAVQSKSGISAETRWLSSGDFETRWWRETGAAPIPSFCSGLLFRASVPKRARAGAYRDHARRYPCPNPSTS